MNERYAWAGGDELLHLTPGSNGISIIAALPPFEEANRTRALMATVLCDLNARGYTTALPDLPGQGDSLRVTSDARLSDWRTAFAAAAAVLPGRVHGVAVRAGALVDVDTDLASRWMLSPQGGSALTRELARLRELGNGLAAGNTVDDVMIDELTGAQPAITGPIRTVRLASEAQPADRKLGAAPLWRRAEPDNDPVLAQLLADDIAEWIGSATPALIAPVETLSTGSGRTGVDFACASERLAGTLDPAAGLSGLLIVSGGNEIRIGAHRGMALLAQRVAAAGYPVFRFDRRGVGDSTGANGGFESSAADVAAAAARFRALQPQLTRLVGFGNCDAATALALFGRGTGIDELVLANPWTIEPTDDLPAPAAIRARYAAKLRDPREVWRLLSGGVNFGKLVRGLRRAGVTAPSGLADRLRAVLPADATVLIAKSDNTAVAFRAAFPTAPVIERDTASHSFAGPADADWLFARILEKLR